MPIYEYACSSCGFEKDYLQKMSDPLLTDCPQCGKASLYKKLSAPGFQLKGSGWYATDFKGSSSSAAPSAPATDSTEKAAPTSSSSESSDSSSSSSSDAGGKSKSADGACAA